MFAGEETLPGWAATLARQIGDGGAQAPPDILSPTVLIEELLSIVDGMTRGHEPSKKRDSASLQEDIKLAFAELGRAVSALHAQSIRGFLAQVGNLPKALESVGGAKASAPLAAVLLNELASPESRAAAFEDVVSAFRDLDGVDICELRIRQLRSFVVGASHDWDERAKLVVDALADRVRAQVGVGASPPDDAGTWLEPAGLTLDQRLAIAVKLLEAEPRRVDAIVWLAYANATVNPFYLKKGPLEFYDGRIWSAATSGHWPGNADWKQPVELADSDAGFHLDGVPDADFVMVRVALQGVRVNEAADRARALTDAALALTGWESQWRALQGAPTYTTHWFGSVGFLDPLVFAYTPPPVLDPTSTELATASADLLVRLAANEQATNGTR
jgi:hypothetical protein